MLKGLSPYDGRNYCSLQLQEVIEIRNYMIMGKNLYDVSYMAMSYDIDIFIVSYKYGK